MPLNILESFVDRERIRGRNKMLKNLIRLYLARKQWRRANVHNDTAVVSLFDQQYVKVGNYTYGDLDVSGSRFDSRLFIGNFCSIGGDVIFLLAREHCLSYVSTFPLKVKIMHYDDEAVSKGDILVEDDVWIGQRSIILSGVHIGQGAVIAAGSVVSKDVPPYAVVAGVPAKVVKYRFSPELISELLKIDYSKLSQEDIKKHINNFYETVSDAHQLNWMPKKK